MGYMKDKIIGIISLKKKSGVPQLGFAQINYLQSSSSIEGSPDPTGEGDWA